MDGSGEHDSLIAQIMVGAIIFPFILVVFLLFLHLYAKWFWWRTQPPPAPGASRRHRRRLVFASGQDPAFTLRTGLDAAVLRSIPVVTFTPQNFEDGLECAVCLSEVVEGERARLLPKCNHGFHVECIDMWFQSHSTCPLCRNPVDLQRSISMEMAEVIDSQSPEEISVSGSSTESPNFPTNVLFWGNETQVSTGGASLEEGSSSTTASSSSSSSSSSTLSTSRRGEMLVIDIPATMSEQFLSLSPTGSPQEELKSPMTRRMRSFKRLLSRERRVSPRCGSSTNSSISSDTEQVRKG
ncbi:RING-H2 finger protein ATL3-like [Mangifera indica]|uniref:RING-H2 finger protein ATL3-like n=1 Tax=Mangifera indica TaxID=29780 RepID=UPI001CF9FBF4|nr:RING-H2 finger protein ATL3-like [Mangifera indica]